MDSGSRRTTPPIGRNKLAFVLMRAQSIRAYCSCRGGSYGDERQARAGRVSAVSGRPRALLSHTPNLGLPEVRGDRDLAWSSAGRLEGVREGLAHGGGAPGELVDVPSFPPRQRRPSVGPAPLPPPLPRAEKILGLWRCRAGTRQAWPVGGRASGERNRQRECNVSWLRARPKPRASRVCSEGVS